MKLLLLVFFTTFAGASASTLPRDNLSSRQNFRDEFKLSIVEDNCTAAGIPDLGPGTPSSSGGGEESKPCQLQGYDIGIEDNVVIVKHYGNTIPGIKIEGITFPDITIPGKAIPVALSPPFFLETTTELFTVCCPLSL